MYPGHDRMSRHSYTWDTGEGGLIAVICSYNVLCDLLLGILFAARHLRTSKRDLNGGL